MRSLLSVLRLILVGVLLVLSIVPAYAQQPVDFNAEIALVWEQLHAQPDDFSIACMPVAERPTIALYHANDPFPLASVSKLLIFIEYAQQVDAGIIPRDEMVDVETLNRFDLPRTNGGAHERFLEQFPANARSISLWDVAITGMMQYSSNAASDLVLARLGPVDWDSLYQTLDIVSTEHPHSMGIIALLMNNHETGETRLSEVPSLDVTQGEALFDRYLHDAEWRQAEIDYRAGRRRVFPAWDVQAAILQQVTAKGTTRDFLNVMAAVYGPAGPLSDSVKTMVRTALRWRDNAFLDSVYAEYGSKLGYYSGGTLALAAYGSPYLGGPVFSIVFIRNIPRQVYNEMRYQDSIGYLAHWMIANDCVGLLDAIYTHD